MSYASRIAVTVPSPGTRAPIPAHGACEDLVVSPWVTPFAPATPPERMLLCSQRSSLVWDHLISSTRASPVTAQAPFLCGPARLRGELKTSQVPAGYVRASMGSSTPWACSPSHHNDDEHVAFDLGESLSGPDHTTFDAQYPWPHAPLPTLHDHPRGWPRTARGDMRLVSTSYRGTCTRCILAS